MPATTTPHKGGHTLPVAAVATVVLFVTLLLGWAGKAICVDGERGFWADTRYCYSDVSVLYGHRGFDVDAMPYAGVPEEYGPDRDYTFEYPPGLAFGAWGVAKLTDTRAGFFNLTALTLAVAALVTLRIARRALAEDEATGQRPPWSVHPWRIMGWAASPSIVLFGFQNWDLWVVLPTVAGLAAGARGRWRWAAVLFAVGAAVKWWPAMLVLTLLAGPWSTVPGRPFADLTVLRERLRPAVLAAGTWLALQVPALMVSPSGWWAAHRFHLDRDANWDSAVKGLELFGNWLLPSSFWSTGFRTLASWGGLALLLVIAAYVVWRLDEATLHPYDAALVLVAAFLVTGRVFSPQFLVWVVPIALLARVSWVPVLALEMVNGVVWLFTGPFLGGLGWGFVYAAQAAAVLRRGVLLWLILGILVRPDTRLRLGLPLRPDPVGSGEGEAGPGHAPGEGRETTRKAAGAVAAPDRSSSRRDRHGRRHPRHGHPRNLGGQRRGVAVGGVRPGRRDLLR